MLMFLSPVLVPIFALLVLLPRRVLRKRDVTGYPPTLLAGVTTYWVSMVLGLWSMPVSGDSGFDPTPMQMLFPGVLLGARGATFIFTVAIFLGFLGIVVAFGSAVALRAEQKFRRRSWIAALSALIGVPLLLVGGGMAFTAVSLRGEPDLDGYREIDVAGFTPEEMDELQRDAQASFDSDLEDVRQALPEANWTSNLAWAPDSCAFYCTYEIAINWYGEADASPEEIAEVLEAHLLESGWRVPGPDAPRHQREQILRTAEQDVNYIARTYFLGDGDELRITVQWQGEVFEDDAVESADEGTSNDADSAESEHRNSSEIKLEATRGPFWYPQR